ncbi:MAG: site-specific DNA-methyltransferase [Pedobacter sp.]|nr:MAG: site-specific DNA-methyltransferase [Pedobacter sp.]
MSIDKLDLQSPDLVNANFQKLAELFPNCVTETEEGKAIDFDLLKQELNHAVVEGNKERYRLEWPGKKEAIVTANIPTTKTLRPVREDSVNFDNTENIYIEGDNLEVLKLLQESYLGKIKMIYIDPPYNTGKDFVYKDNFARDIQEELIESGQKDEYNQRLVVNPETAGRYHSDWLSMMYPRLKLARNLLKNDGVIFISIDDSEVDNLKKIADEIFGETNFLTRLVWRRRKTQANLAKNIAPVHDFIVIYAKSLPDLKFYRVPFSEEFIKKSFSNPDQDKRGLYQTGPLARPANSSNKEYELTMPNGRRITAKWSCSQETFNELVKDDRLVIPRDGEGMPRKKIFLSELEGLLPNTWLDNIASNDDGAREIAELFGSNAYFSYPKPTKLIEYLINIGSDDKGIVLDFFAGSSSTAQAVIQLNSREQKNRKYIMVQIPEEFEPLSEPGLNGYRNISELSKERIRRAARKIKEETGVAIDYGFRVYRLSESNMQDVYYKPQDYQQANLDLFADNVKPDRTADDLLAQVMLDWGLQLSLKIEQVTVAGKQVYKVAQNSLYACFDKGIDEAFAKAIAQDKPLRIVFRDKGFKDDTAKTNVRQLLKQLSPETEMKVI